MKKRGRRKRDQIRRLTIRAGVMMYPRDPLQRHERAKNDHTVMALPSTAGGEDAWSFLRGGELREKWYVRADDVSAEDFPDLPNYRDSRVRNP